MNSGQTARIAAGAARACTFSDMEDTEDQINSLTERVIGCAIEVHRVMGPGLLEAIYHGSLVIELKAADMKVESKRRVRIEYKGQRATDDLRLVVEVKAVEKLHPIHIAQVVSYLKLTGYPAGLLINFNTTSLRNGGLKRLDHPDRYRRKTLLISLPPVESS
ncbi:MAG: GxxExxY protein [Vicinamibacterales bacterium]